MKNKIYSVQDWLPYVDIYNNGIIKLKNNSYAKIISVSPINFNLKSNLEKEAILNSYKTFLKTCKFNLQILIQSNKEDLTSHISNIENINKNENNKIKKIKNNYINYIQEINKKRKSSSKNFYIILKEFHENKKEKLNEENEKYIIDKLNENYFKIKECLARCGNSVTEISKKEETEKILYSFLNSRKDLNIN